MQNAAVVNEDMVLIRAVDLETHEAEIQFWRADLAARLLFDTGLYEAARREGREDAQGDLANRLRSSIATFDAAVAGEWHLRCGVCGEFVLPGEPTASGEVVSGHWRCLTDDEPPAGDAEDPAADLVARVERARTALNAPWKPDDPEPARPLMVPCDACADGFITAGDRHARTAKDVCPKCGGDHMVPAATGTSAETSAPLAIPAAEHDAPASGSFLDPVPALYTNHRGVTRVRQLAPAIGPDGPMRWCPADEYHEAGWRIRSLDVEAGHRRWYPVASILAWGAEAIAAYQAAADELRILRAQRMAPVRERELLEANNRLLERARAAEARGGAAARTLRDLGYTYTDGAELWRPPVGPEPDFEAADRRRELAQQLRGLCEGMMPGLAETAVLGEAAEALDAVPAANAPRTEAIDRLARIEALFAEDRKERGLTPAGRIEDQVRDALARARGARAA